MKTSDIKEVIDDIPDNAEWIIFNDGSAFEWYGVDSLDNYHIVNKRDVVYITMSDSDYELAYVNEHYRQYKKGMINLTDPIDRSNLDYDEILYRFKNQKR